MKWMRVRAAAVALATLAAVACSEPPEPPAPEIQVDPLQCFRNEFGDLQLDGGVDVQELRIEFDGTKATGVYNWLPAEKDARRGSFEGELGEESVVLVDYSFSQEGQEKTAQLRIKLHPGQATVTSKTPGSGLDASLKRVDCDGAASSG